MVPPSHPNLPTPPASPGVARHPGHRLAFLLQLAPLACCGRALFLDPRALPFIWPYAAVSVLALALVGWNGLRPTDGKALACYVAIAALVPALAYSVWAWPWIAKGGAPLGREAWAMSASLATLGGLFIAWPLVFSAHLSLRR